MYFLLHILPLAPIYTAMADDPEVPAHPTASDSNSRASARHGKGRIYLYAVLFFIWAFAIVSVGVGEFLNGSAANERSYVCYRCPCMGQISSRKESRQSGRNRANGR